MSFLLHRQHHDLDDVTNEKKNDHHLGWHFKNLIRTQSSSLFFSIHDDLHQATAVTHWGNWKMRQEMYTYKFCVFVYVTAYVIHTIFKCSTLIGQKKVEYQRVEIKYFPSDVHRFLLRREPILRKEILCHSVTNNLFNCVAYCVTSHQKNMFSSGSPHL